VARTLEHVSDGLLVLDRSWRITFANATAAQLLSRPTGDLVGSDIWTLFAAAVGGEIWHRYHDAVEQQREQTFEAFFGPLEGWFQVRLLPAPDSLTVYFRNIDAERSARLERDENLREQAHRLLLADRLQELTDALGRAVTVREVAKAVLEHSQGALDALFAGVALLDPGASTLTFVSLDELPDRVREEWTRVSLSTPAPLTDCVRRNTGYYHESPEALLASYPDLAGTITSAGNSSFVNLPIPGTRGVIGALSMSWVEPRSFGADDRRFLVTVAAQCGQAIERARLHERQQTVADALQQAVLPERLPLVAGVSLAARYIPTPLEVSVHVGGDWYDAFQLPDGRLGMAVGDVSGHGLSAAAIMGTLRNALRAYAFDGDDPAAVLGALNRLLVATSDNAFATAVYGILDDGLLTWCSAGHPPFAILDGEGRARLVTDRTGPLLGLPDSRYRSRTLTLAPGDAVVLYTDGLIEHRSWTLDDAFVHLVRVLERQRGRGVGELCEALVREGRGGRGQEDDACVLVLRHHS
jgi:PAS domain-containing protein